VDDSSTFNNADLSSSCVSLPSYLPPSLTLKEQAHKMQYLQHFHHLFNSNPNSTEQNIVIVPGRNFDLLPETMADLLNDDERAERIANNSFAFYRHWLSPASVDCYWRRYALSFLPSRTGTDGEGIG
jgi:hypothetical protein